MYKKGRVNSNSRIISTDEDPSLRIESSAIINLRGVPTKLNKYILYNPAKQATLHVALVCHLNFYIETYYLQYNNSDDVVDNKNLTPNIF